jgi:hypothetical protein
MFLKSMKGQKDRTAHPPHQPLTMIACLISVLLTHHTSCSTCSSSVAEKLEVSQLALPAYKPSELAAAHIHLIPGGSDERLPILERRLDLQLLHWA